jgi:uncharacterized protein
MPVIIDRRLTAEKSSGNRDKLLRRSKSAIQTAIKESIKSRELGDIIEDTYITVPTKTLKEYYFKVGKKGDREVIIPGNDRWHVGDQIYRPDEDEGGGSGSGQGSGDGDDEEDAFIFRITKKEFMQYLFDELGLPDFLKNTLGKEKIIKQKRAGFITEGSPNNLDIVKSLKNAIGRRLSAKAEHEETDEQYTPPYLIPEDLRYRHHVKVEESISKAVMYLIMDVSGSMGEHEKDLAKRFFLLLSLFLEHNYEEVELVFMRYHTSANIVSEREFFYERTSGGTAFSCAIELLIQDITENYTEPGLNIYVSIASDGDNSFADNKDCEEIVTKSGLLNKIRHLFYIETLDYERYTNAINREAIHKEGGTYLTEFFKSLNSKTVSIGRVTKASQIYKAFSGFFEKT